MDGEREGRKKSYIQALKKPGEGRFSHRSYIEKPWVRGGRG